MGTVGAKIANWGTIFGIIQRTVGDQLLKDNFRNNFGDNSGDNFRDNLGDNLGYNFEDNLEDNFGDIFFLTLYYWCNGWRTIFVTPPTIFK